MAKFTRKVPGTACSPEVESDGWITVYPDPAATKRPERGDARSEFRPPADPLAEGLA